MAESQQSASPKHSQTSLKGKTSTRDNRYICALPTRDKLLKITSNICTFEKFVFVVFNRKNNQMCLH